MRKLLILPFLSLPLMAQGVRYDASATTSATNLPYGAQAQVLTVPGANVTVCSYPAQAGPNNDCANPVTVYADQGLTQPIANPVTADNLGRFGFFLPPGVYSYSIDNAAGNYVGTFSFSIAQPLYGIVNIDQFQGTCAQQLAAADAAYAGQAKTLWVVNPCSLTAPVTLSANHNLLMSDVITASGSGFIIPTANNTITCTGAGGFVNGGMTNASGNLMNPFVYATGASASNLRVTGCHVEGGSNYATIYYSNSSTQGLQIDHNTVHNAELWMQHSSPTSNPTVSFDVSHNSVNWDAGIDPGLYPVTAYGASSNGTVQANRITNGRGGTEFFQVDQNGNPGAINPSYDTVYAQGLTDISVSNNVFSNIRGGQSPIFFSFAAHVLAEGNEIDGADDVGIDFEACVDSAAIGNSVRNDATAAMGEFFTAVHNSFINNHITSNSSSYGIIIKNAGGYSYISTDTTVAGNTYHSVNPAGVGIFAYIETSSGMKMIHNDVTDGILVSGGGYLNGEVVKGNYIHLTRILPTSGLGPGNSSGFGLPLFNNNDGSRMEASDNTIVTDVTQTVPCLSGANSNSNPPVAVYYFTNNNCGGTWGDTVVNSGSPNNGIQPVYVFRNNQLPTANIVKTTSTGNYPTVVATGNYVGASSTQVTAQ